MPTIHHTKDYDLFQLDNNREIYPKHVQTIASDPLFPDSFKYHPIVVNENYWVVDGQHRMLAGKKLSIPIWFVIQKDADEKHIKACNINQKSWNYQDYINFYAKQNVATYVIIKNLSNTHSIPLHLVTLICQYFGTSGRRFDFNRQLKNGTLVLKNLDKTNLFIDLYDNLLKTMTKEKGCVSVKYLLSRYYCAALIFLYKKDDPKLKIILRKIPEFWKKLISVDSQEQALEVLDLIKSSKRK